MLSMLLLLSLLVPGLDGIVCEPDSECRGQCSGENAEAGVQPGTGGNVIADIHICSQPTGCSYTQQSHPSSSDNRMSLCKDGCKVTIAPEQGKTRGQVQSCADLRVACGSC